MYTSLTLVPKARGIARPLYSPRMLPRSPTPPNHVVVGRHYSRRSCSTTCIVYTSMWTVKGCTSVGRSLCKLPWFRAWLSAVARVWFGCEHPDRGRRFGRGHRLSRGRRAGSGSGLRFCIASRDPLLLTPLARHPSMFLFWNRETGPETGMHLDVLAEALC